MDRPRTLAVIVSSVLAASVIPSLLWNHRAVETTDDGGIDVDGLLEDTQEADQDRRDQEQCVGLQAQQLLNALQKVEAVNMPLNNTLN
jgi:hypothetical protein